MILRIQLPGCRFPLGVLDVRVERATTGVQVERALLFRSGWTLRSVVVGAGRYGL